MKHFLMLLVFIGTSVCTGEPISSSLGARGMALVLQHAETNFTAADYVQGGLVCMWDAIENSDWGVHDDSATAWTELVSGTADAIVGNLGTRYVWSDNALVSYTDGNTFTSDRTDVLLEPFQTCTFTLESTTSAPTASHTWQPQIFNICKSGQGYSQGLILRYRRENNGACGNVYTGTYTSGPSITVSPLDALHTWTCSYNEGVGSFYADGLYVGGATVNPDQTITSTIVRIGSSSYQFQGCYHSIRIYNRALTADEIAHNAQIDQARFGL